MKLADILAKGATEEVAKEILKLHQDTIKDAYVPLTRFNEVNTELTNAKTSLKERDTQIDGLKKFEGDNAKLQEEIKKVQTTNSDNETKYKNEIILERKKNAVRFSLLENEASKPHDADMVSGLYDLNLITVGDDGKIASGFKEQDEKIRKEKAFLFKAVETQQQQQGGWKPFGTPPKEGEKGGAADAATNFGMSLAATKLGMLGKTPTQPASDGAIKK